MIYIWQAVLLIILFFFSVLTSASESAIISLSSVQLQRLKAGGKKSSKIISDFLKFPEKLFGTILVGNNLANIALAAFGTALLVSAFGEEKGALLATVAITSLVIIGEITSKTYSVNNPEKVSSWIAHPISWLYLVLKPLVRIFTVITNIILFPFKGKKLSKFSLTRDDLIMLITEGERQGVISQVEKDMMEEVFDFKEITSERVMLKMDKVTCIPEDASLLDATRLIQKDKHSRLPVFSGSRENIVGVIHAKDVLLAHDKPDLKVKEIMRPVLYVPVSARASETLKNLQKNHYSVAIVANDKKQALGFMTVEDLVEEIVGEIEDEYDR